MDKRYYAFISYKREDEKQAKCLQDKLEHYRFPTNLNGRTDLPKNVRPIFRDVTDLTPGILAEEIKKALNDSQWLIIVCSPRSAKSPWVCKEAQSFIDSGRADRIIPYVIEGVPFSGDEATECYPEALLNMKGNKELLAANVNEIGREAAAIKILARMFGLRFDTLWQRHTREQKKRRIIWGTIAAFMVVVSMLISGYFYWANNEIKEKQNKLLISQSKYLASEAQKEYDKGNITKALRMALYALPKDLKNMDRPYVPEAEIMLRECDKPQKEGIYSQSILQHVNQVNSAQFSPDGKYIVTAFDDNTARVWDAKTGEPVTEPLKHEDSVNSAQFSPDGKYIVTASYDYTARVWDAKTGEPVTESLRHEGPVYSAQFSPDGKYIVTASSDNTARVWYAKTGEQLTEPLKHEDYVKSAQFSPDGKYIVTASWDNTARVWNARTGEPVTEPLMHENWVNSAQFSPDGKYIVTSSWDNTARVWNARTGEPVTEPLKHENSVNSAQFSPDGKYIVTASDDNTARVWDAKTGEPVTEPLKHENSVNSAQFSPDGKYIVTASYDYTARVWDAKTGEPVTESLRHEGPVYSAQFSPNGKYIVTASWEWDKTAKVWEFPPLEELIDKYRNDLEHDWSLSEEEKAEYNLE
ncbi:MAG: TIR domain-containing protein [Bacteroidaceae bacterium]|nr:TIR domain-containing protein [Bacteroidaceae bacterium]